MSATVLDTALDPLGCELALHPVVQAARRGKLLKSSPKRDALGVSLWGTCDRWVAPARPIAVKTAEKTKRPGSLRNRASTCVRVRGALLRASSIARMHPILMTQRRDRSLAKVGMPFIHRAGLRVGTGRPCDGRMHERTLAQQGQRTVGDVALGFHDECFGVVVA